MRWFELESTFADDDKIGRILRKFKNSGLGALIRVWGHVASKGAKPGMAIDSHGEPFDLENLADKAGVTKRYLMTLLNFAADVRHIDQDLWRARGVVLFPAMAKRAAKYHEGRSSTERSEDRRLRRFDRIAARDGHYCSRCPATEQLELERRIPKDAGGGTEDANLAIVCVPCGRKRRAERQAEAEGDSLSDRNRSSSDQSSEGFDHSNSQSDQQNRAEQRRTQRQDSAEPDVLLCTVRSSLLEDPRSTHTAKRDDAREPSPPAVEPERPLKDGRLPLLTALHNASAGRSTGSIHTGHAWCFRKCVPGFLHSEFLESIGGEAQTADERVRAFYRAVAEAIPAADAIPDPPLVFWRRQFASRFGAAEAIKSKGVNALRSFPQDSHNSSTVSTGTESARRQVGRAIGRSRR